MSVVFCEVVKVVNIFCHVKMYGETDGWRLGNVDFETKQPEHYGRKWKKTQTK